METTKICPKCGKTYRGHPALSRVDNETPICPECGTREALEGLGIPPEEIENIIHTIQKHFFNNFSFFLFVFLNFVNCFY